jgi:hypothetical protein
MQSVCYCLVVEIGIAEGLCGTEAESVIVVVVFRGCCPTTGFVLVPGAKIVVQSGWEGEPGYAGGERLTIVNFMCMFLRF